MSGLPVLENRKLRNAFGEFVSVCITVIYLDLSILTSTFTGYCWWLFRYATASVIEPEKRPGEIIYPDTL
jgi:hypothetical protein